MCRTYTHIYTTYINVYISYTRISMYTKKEFQNPKKEKFLFKKIKN